MRCNRPVYSHIRVQAAGDPERSEGLCRQLPPASSTGAPHDTKLQKASWRVTYRARSCEPTSYERSQRVINLFFLRNIIPVWVPGKVPRFPKGRFLSHQDGFQYQPGSVWQSQTPAARPADEELCSPTSDHTQSSLDTFQRPLSLSVSINGNSLIRVL